MRAVNLLDSIGKTVFLCPVQSAVQNTQRSEFKDINHARLRLDKNETSKHQIRRMQTHFCDLQKKQSTNQYELSCLECIVCLDAKPSVLAKECGHAVMCKECAQELMVTNSRCPVCRTPTKQLIQLMSVQK